MVDVRARVMGQGKPLIPPGCQRILDVGCGDGGALAESEPPPESLAVATDISLNALKACSKRFPTLLCVCAFAEDLPYRGGSFDVYLARSSWPYTNLQKTVPEAFRVLAPGGYLWASMRTGTTALRWLIASIQKRYAHGIVFHIYVILNGLMFHLIGKTFRFPFNWSGMSHYESFHTCHAMRRLFRSAGFDEVRFIKRQFTEVTARRAAA